ncbi:putative NBD/HSP70 family sugar kinase [Nakamurella sp. UYEF19]|uniref:ROK family transcriptional regulator n=1 Tax=Nakamurella sp. UYEF19 TaxID=1756392 RepID=UPI003393DFDF
MASGIGLRRRGPLVVTTSSAVRIINERAVFDDIAGRPEASVAELVASTGLSKPTVTLAVNNLERLGLLDQQARRTGNTGRTPRVYRIHGRAGTVVALDVGRAWLRVAVVTLAGEVLQRSEVKTRLRSGRILLDQIEQVSRDAVEAARRQWDELTLVVLGGPGVFDAENDIIRLAPNLPGWERTDTVPELRRRLGAPLQIENDVNLAAIAETARGSGPDFVFVSAGTGLGMGIVLNGRLLRGAQGAAGELAYLPFAPGDPTFSPGHRHPRLETSVAPQSIVNRARDEGLADVSSSEQVFAAARAGQPAADRAVLEEGYHLGTVIAAVVAVIDPGKVVLAGGIGRNGDLLLGPIRSRLRELVPLRPPEVTVSATGPDGSLLGAIDVGVAGARDTAFTRAQRSDRGRDQDSALTQKTPSSP